MELDLHHISLVPVHPSTWGRRSKWLWSMWASAVCKSPQSQGSNASSKKERESPLVLELKYKIFLYLPWPWLFWLMTCFQVWLTSKDLPYITQILLALHLFFLCLGPSPGSAGNYLESVKLQLFWTHGMPVLSGCPFILLHNWVHYNGTRITRVVLVRGRYLKACPG